MTVYLAETYTGMAGNVMTGDGLKTGTAANNGAPHRVDSALIAAASGSCTWYLLADEKTFLLQVAAFPTLYTFDSTNVENSRYSSALYVGEDSAGHFIAVGGQNTTSAALYNYFYGAGFTAVKDPSTGLIIGNGGLAVVLAGLPSQDILVQSTAGYLNLSAAELCRVPWVAGNTEAGYLRGVALAPALMFSQPSQASVAIGGPSINTRNANTLIDLGDGHGYFLALNWRAAPSRIHTDNPEFW